MVTTRFQHAGCVTRPGTGLTSSTTPRRRSFGTRMATRVSVTATKATTAHVASAPSSFRSMSPVTSPNEWLGADNGHGCGIDGAPYATKRIHPGRLGGTT